MQLRDILRAHKTNVALGEWREGPVPRRDFPMNRKNRPYRVPAGTRWRVLAFDALDEKFRVLVMFHEGKALYRATLGRLVGRDMSIICSYDHDATKPGWHCHAVCGAIDALPVCVQRAPWVRRIPKGGARHNRQEFKVSERSAAGIAADFYRFRGSLL